MTYLIISDIHANLEALEAALAAAAPHDAVLVLGDLVGYGADPNAVVERVRALPDATIIRGNHDKVGAGVDTVESFNKLARQAIEWTSRALTADNRAWLAALQAGPVMVDEQVEICHGSPFDEDFYVFDELDAVRALTVARRPLCLFGHTHVPAVFSVNTSAAGDHSAGRRGRELDALAPVKDFPFTLQLADEHGYLVNCGAVGQPRDMDARAAFGLLDGGARRLTLCRTPYDVAAAQEKIVRAGLPEVLARRLALGR